MIQKLFSHAALSREWEYLPSKSNAAMLLLEPEKHFHVHVYVLCFLGNFCFAIKNKGIWFNCFLLLKHSHGVTVDGESPSSFATSARFHSGSRSTAAKSQVSHLSTMAYASFWPWFRRIQNGMATRVSKMSGTMQVVPSQREEQG